MHCNTLKQDNDSTVRGDGGGRVGEVRAGTTSTMPEHKGFKLQKLSRDPLTPADGPGSVSVNTLLAYLGTLLHMLPFKVPNLSAEFQSCTNRDYVIFLTVSVIGGYRISI